MRSITAILAQVLPFLLGAQSVSITFSAQRGAYPVPLDSIRVVNLANGTDTVLYAPDTVLTLVVAGMGDLRSAHGPYLQMAGENPYRDRTSIDLVVRNGGPVTLVVMDLAGRILASLAQYVKAGTQQIELEGGQGPLLLVAEMGEDRALLRLLPVGGEGKPRLNMQTKKVHSSEGNAKSGDLQWTPGDELVYTGWCTLEVPYEVVGPGNSGIPVGQVNEVFMLPQPCEGSEVVYDVEGNAYATTQIGSQCWLAENLRVGQFNTGDPIPQSTIWGVQTPAWCSPHNLPALEEIYGKFYNWYVVSDPRGVCPVGWHVPTRPEWLALANALGGDTIAGGALKSTSPLWLPPNAAATNATGFSALPAGFRWQYGNHWDLGIDGHWWTASQPSGSLAYYIFITLGSGSMNVSANPRLYGYSIRCLKD